jgi:hypothetical protein
LIYNDLGGKSKQQKNEIRDNYLAAYWTARFRIASPIERLETLPEPNTNPGQWTTSGHAGHRWGVGWYRHSENSKKTQEKPRIRQKTWKAK